MKATTWWFHISLLLKMSSPPLFFKIWEPHDSWNSLTLYITECYLTDDSKELVSQSEVISLRKLLRVFEKKKKKTKTVHTQQTCTSIDNC